MKILTLLKLFLMNKGIVSPKYVPGTCAYNSRKITNHLSKIKELYGEGDFVEVTYKIDDTVLNLKEHLISSK